MTPEKKVKQRMVKHLKDMGAYYFFPQMGPFGRSGVPDIIVCLKGVFIALECKANGNKTTPLQDQEIEKIRAAEGSAWVVNEGNVDNVAAILYMIAEGNVPTELQDRINTAQQKSNPYNIIAQHMTQRMAQAKMAPLQQQIGQAKATTEAEIEQIQIKLDMLYKAYESERTNKGQQE